MPGIMMLTYYFNSAPYVLMPKMTISSLITQIETAAIASAGQEIQLN